MSGAYRFSLSSKTSKSDECSDPSLTKNIPVLSILFSLLKINIISPLFVVSKAVYTLP